MIMPEIKSNMPQANRVNSMENIPFETKILDENASEKVNYIRSQYKSNNIPTHFKNITEIEF